MCKGHEKLDRLLSSKNEINYPISQQNKKINLLIQFSQIWLILANKCLANSKSPKSIFFSRCIHFSFSTVSWLFFSFSILLLKEMQTTDNVSRVKCLNFSGKVLKFVHAQLYFFAVWFLTFFQVQLISFVKRKVNSTIEQRKLEGHEKLDRLLVSKWT